VTVERQYLIISSLRMPDGSLLRSNTCPASSQFTPCVGWSPAAAMPRSTRQSPGRDATAA